MTKNNAGLSGLMVGLGWDEASKSGGSGKGLLGSLFGGGKGNTIDCDASVLMLDEKGKIANKKNVVYFGNLNSPCGSVVHKGDNLTGAGEGDDEQVFVELKKVPANVHKLVFVVNIYKCQEKKQDFGMIKNAFIRIVDNATQKELAKFNLTEDYAGKTALVVGEVYRHNGEWKFSATGQSTNDISLSDLVRRYS